MTCDEINAEIAAHNTHLGELNADISDKADEIDDQKLICIASDGWPGGAPTTWDQTSVSSRLSYLNIYRYMNWPQHVAIELTIEKYDCTSVPPGKGIKQLMQEKTDLQTQASMTQGQINFLLGLKQQQGC